MAVDQDGKFSSKRSRSLKPKQTKPTPKKDDSSVFEYVSSSIRVTVTLRHIKAIARGCAQAGCWLANLASRLAMACGTLLLMVLRSAKTLLIGTMAAVGVASMFLGVAVWQEPEIFANILAPPFEQGSNADRGFSGCVPQESTPDLPVWP